MSMRMANGKREQSFFNIKSQDSQRFLIDKHFVPIAKSAPAAKNDQATNGESKIRPARIRKSRERVMSFLKPPLVSTNGHGLSQTQIQEWTRGSCIGINAISSSDSKPSKRQKTLLKGWQQLRQYRENLKMHIEEKNELPFPYNPEVWKVKSGSSLFSSNSFLTLPQDEITNWDSDLYVTPESMDDDTGKFDVEESNSKIVNVSLKEEESVSIEECNKNAVLPQLGESHLLQSIDYTDEKVVSADNDTWSNSSDLIPVSVLKNHDEAAMEERCNFMKRYSWQILDVGLQTSRTLLESLFNAEQQRIEKENEENANLQCQCKYSWQIIGVGTQTSPNDYEESNASSVISVGNLASSKLSQFEAMKTSRRPPNESTRQNRKSCKILINEMTQTCATKENQTNFTDIYAQQRKISSKIYV